MKDEIIHDDNDGREAAFMAGDLVWNGRKLFPLSIARESYFQRLRKAHAEDGKEDSTMAGTVILLWLLHKTPSEIVDACADSKSCLKTIWEWSETNIRTNQLASAMLLIDKALTDAYGSAVKVKSKAGLDQKKTKPVRSGKRGS